MFGFLKGKSTNDAMVHLIDYNVQGLDTSEKVRSILLDLSKNFGSVDFKLMLKKQIGVQKREHLHFGFTHICPTGLNVYSLVETPN